MANQSTYIILLLALLNISIRANDLNSNITGLCRKGLTLYYEDVSEVTEYGDIDNITFLYAGNRIIKSTDSAVSSTFYNSTDFKDSF